jgi:hypothetical protein
MLDLKTLMVKHYGTDDYEKIEAMKKEDQAARDETPIDKVTKLRIPYYAPDDSLPPIPTPQDVENARPLSYSQYGTKYIYRVNTVYAVKFGHFMSLVQVRQNNENPINTNQASTGS